MNTSTRFPDPRAVAMADPQAIQPLTPLEMVTDDVLRRFATSDAARDRGEFSPEDQMTLAMLLPDICGELLARRGAALTIVHVPSEDRMNLDAARALLRRPGRIERDIMVTACQTILQLSRDTCERNCASDILGQLGDVA